MRTSPLCGAPGGLSSSRPFHSPFSRDSCSARDLFSPLLGAAHSPTLYRIGRARQPDRLAAALSDRSAALIACHGAVAVGASPEEALMRAEKIEEMAQLFWLSRFLKEEHEKRT